MPRKNFSVVRIVDDNPAFRESEAFMLRMMGYNVAEYASALEFLENDDPSVEGCVILDVKMPEMDGLQLQEVMTEQSIGLPIIFLTGHGNVEMAVNALHRGASDFLQKPVEGEKLRASVERALAENASRREHDREIDDARARFDRLTPREQDVSRLVARGLLNKQIAAELGVTEHTVKVHRAAARFKLNARTTADFADMLRLIGEF
ncbi:response regulator transcription factor [Sutterella sp.]|uniref:response regulator transcription factor n=1 Tax=Sutterella sp. TaxID=1981025 RepID=UPI0026DEEFD3|nr:response regulator [Sutterella sp.]MDO5531226.1 response regulator [Sutterella sp.]